MWNMRKDKAAFVLLESIMSLLLLSMVALTLLIPITQNLDRLAEKRAETEHWRFLQDTMAQTLQGDKAATVRRLSAGQAMEVRWFPDGEGLSLSYSTTQGQGSVELFYDE